MATSTFMFLVNDRLVWRDKTVPRALVHVLLIFFAVFKNLKSSFSEDNIVLGIQIQISHLTFF